MKIVLAPNAFKGSLSAVAVAEAMRAGVLDALPNAEIISKPVADGGDGVAEVLADFFSGTLESREVIGPLGEHHDAAFCHVPERQLAVVEMAAASGLALLNPSDRNPLRASTQGTGELIRAALDLGVTRILVGLGGSATNDGGCGMAWALGVRFLNQDGESFLPTGETLFEITQIEMAGIDSRIKDVIVEGICDVTNPLLGDEGAARVYAPQKGATPADVELLENGLAHLAERLQSDLGIDVRGLEGGGAAGGLGAGLSAFLGATLRRGVDVVLDLVGLEDALTDADLVLTGEGQIDVQTAFGKAPAGVASRAARQGVPCFAFAGSVGDDLTALNQSGGFDAIFTIVPGPGSLDDAMMNASTYVRQATSQGVRAFLAGRSK